MYGNGVGTGIRAVIIHHRARPTRGDLLPVPTVFCAVVVGAVVRGAAVWLAAAAATLAAGTSAAGSG